MREPTLPSRFLEEIPPQLLEDLGSRGRSSERTPVFSQTADSSHYNYEDEDQSASGPAQTYGGGKKRTSYEGPPYNSIEKIAQSFASRRKKFHRPQVAPHATSGRQW